MQAIIAHFSGLFLLRRQVQEDVRGAANGAAADELGVVARGATAAVAVERA